MRALFLIIALALPAVSICDEPERDGLGAPVSSETLAAQRGGDEEIVNNSIRVTGQVSGNTARNVATGANNIQDGSFANSSGITSVVQNTGANVLIQSATIVNVQFAEP